MRQNTIAIQGTIRQSMLAEDREILFKQIDVPAIRIASSDPSGLTDEELLQFNAWLAAFVRTREAQWLQYQSGVLDEVTWRTYLVPLLGTLSWPHVRNWWDSPATGVFNREFVEHVNESLVDSPYQSIPSVIEMLELFREGASDSGR